jgi:hypothetical protein
MFYCLDETTYDELLFDLQRIEEFRILYSDYDYVDEHITKLIDNRFKLFKTENYYKNYAEPNKKR